MAEWWLNEDGGYYCSSCGCYVDDYYDELSNNCPKCHSNMKINFEMDIDRKYRLSKGLEFVDQSNYPQWLLKLRGENK